MTRKQDKAKKAVRRARRQRQAERAKIRADIQACWYGGLTSYQRAGLDRTQPYPHDDDVSRMVDFIVAYMSKHPAKTLREATRRAIDNYRFPPADDPVYWQVYVRAGGH